MASEDWPPIASQQSPITNHRRLPRRVSPRAWSEDFPAATRLASGDSRHRIGGIAGSDMVLLERKMKHIAATGAPIVATGNPGCIGQIRYGAEKFGVSVEVVHPVTLL